MIHHELAELCRRSYDEAGVPGSVEIGGMGAYCCVVSSGEQAVVVFRGTNDVAGWVKNLDSRFSELAYPLGAVHAGFRDCWESLRRRVLAAVGRRKAIVTGHSLGGAMATLAAAELHEANQLRELVTFGTPRVGDSHFAYYLREAKLTRYVYQLDPVPLVPGVIPGYRHACPPTWHDGEGWRLGYSWGQVLKVFVRTLFSLDRIFGKLWPFHSIDNYCAATLSLKA